MLCYHMKEIGVFNLCQMWPLFFFLLNSEHFINIHRKHYWQVKLRWSLWAWRMLESLWYSGITGLQTSLTGISFGSRIMHLSCRKVVGIAFCCLGDAVHTSRATSTGQEQLNSSQVSSCCETSHHVCFFFMYRTRVGLPQGWILV